MKHHLISAWETILSQFNLRFFLISITATLLYIIIALYLLNYRLVFDTLFSGSTIVYKTTLLFSLLGGIWTAFSPIDIFLLLLTAILVGFNMSLVIATINLIRNQGKIRVVVGGSTLLSIIITGCTTCSFSILSLAGLTASIAYLPLAGIELHILSIVLLCISSFYMLKGLHTAKVCIITDHAEEMKPTST